MAGRQSLPVPRTMGCAGLTQMRTPLTLGMVEVENQNAFD